MHAGIPGSEGGGFHVRFKSSTTGEHVVSSDQPGSMHLVFTVILLLHFSSQVALAVECEVNTGPAVPVAAFADAKPDTVTQSSLHILSSAYVWVY